MARYCRPRNPLCGIRCATCGTELRRLKLSGDLWCATCREQTKPHNTLKDLVCISCQRKGLYLKDSGDFKCNYCRKEFPKDIAYEIYKKQIIGK